MVISVSSKNQLVERMGHTLVDPGTNSWLFVSSKKPTWGSNGTYFGFTVQSHGILLFDGLGKSLTLLNDSWTFDREVKAWTELSACISFC